MSRLISDSLLRAVEQGILGLLIGLGAACIAVFVLRWRAVGLAVSGVKPWRDRLEKALADDSPAQPASAAGRGESGAADRLARVGLANPHLCADALEKLLETQEARERALLERGAQFLGTVGANAPFLGLTGTVIGILVAFERFAASGGKGSTEVMVSISQALVATAVGLVVAIPAVVFFNVLKQQSKAVLEGGREVRGLLLARSLQAAPARFAAGAGREI